jgi:hypothetical protein
LLTARTKLIADPGLISSSLIALDEVETLQTLFPDLFKQAIKPSSYIVKSWRNLTDEAITSNES